MKPIRIFSNELELLAEIDNYESFIFTRRYYSYGEFEISINRYKEGAKHLKRGNCILAGADINKAGVIRKVEISLGQEGKNSEIVNAYGYTMESFLYQRLVVPPAGISYDKITADAETVIKHYVNCNMVNAPDTQRNIPLFRVQPNQNRGVAVNWSSRYKNLGEEIEKICMFSGVGTQVCFDYGDRKFDFDVFEGRDLSSAQSLNNPVIFSPAFDNIKAQKYHNSDLGYQNNAYVAGQGEGADRLVEIVGNSTGEDRIETFVDARDLSDSGDLISRGLQYLSETPMINTLESEILTYGSFEYEKDWDLGDIVTVQNSAWGIGMDARITEVTEIYEPEGFKLQAMFGSRIPSLADRVKKEIGKASVEILR